MQLKQPIIKYITFQFYQQKKKIVSDQKKMQRITDKFKIEGLQSFNQYTKINPISIEITESEIKVNCILSQKDINIDL